MFEKIAVVRHGLALLMDLRRKLSDEGKDQARLLAPELSTFWLLNNSNYSCFISRLESLGIFANSHLISKKLNKLFKMR